jgi:hypothetical protein
MMIEEAAKETETIRVVYFDGKDKTKWRESKLKTLASHQTSQELEESFSEQSQNLELEAKEEKTMEDIVKISANYTAWAYLIMPCKGKAFNIVTGVQNDDAFRAWTELKMKFKPNQAKYLVTMIGDFNYLVVEDELEDPTIYIKALEEINE